MSHCEELCSGTDNITGCLRACEDSEKKITNLFRKKAGRKKAVRKWNLEAEREVAAEKLYELAMAVREDLCKSRTRLPEVYLKAFGQKCPAFLLRRSKQQEKPKVSTPNKAPAKKRTRPTAPRPKSKPLPAPQLPPPLPESMLDDSIQQEP